MNKFRAEWAASTKRQKVDYIFCIIAMLMVGVIGVYHAIIYAGSSLHHRDYQSLAIAVGSIIILLILGKIQILKSQGK